MRAGEPTGAEDAEGGGIGARQELCGNGGRGGGTQIGEIVGRDG
jgi:hypothetical protein